MLIIHGTRKFLDRVGPADAATPAQPSTTALGSWYATPLFWKPQVALFVNELTLLPVMLPLAPARTVVDRFVTTAESVFDALHVNQSFIDGEVAEMTEHHLAKTVNRSVIGMLNEFSFLADAYRERGVEPHLLDLSVRLAGTPCGPLRSRQGFPDRELAELVARHRQHER